MPWSVSETRSHAPASGELITIPPYRVSKRTQAADARIMPHPVEVSSKNPEQPPLWKRSAHPKHLNPIYWVAHPLGQAIARCHKVANDVSDTTNEDTESVRAALPALALVDCYRHPQPHFRSSAVLTGLGQFCRGPVRPSVPTVEYLAVLWVQVVLALPEGVDPVRLATLVAVDL